MKIKEQIIALLKEVERPLMDIELAEIFNIDKKQLGEFFAVLDEMERNGEIMITRKKKYAVPEFYGLKRGKIQGTQKGFAFFIPEDASGDVFIPSEALNGAMHGDIVQIAVTSSSVEGKREEGEVQKIIERANTEIVGTFQKGNAFGFVVPDEKKINVDVYVPESLVNGAESGDKVVVRIIKWPTGKKNPEGKIIENLGKKGSNEADILSVIRKFKLPEAFPKKVVAEAESISVDVLEEDIVGRRDLRNDIVFTIDGSDAKDLDDAVSLKMLENGNFLLGVHIADVTHYVKENSKLDKEALKRATSVYLIDRVIPMLPKRLSNGVCSLNPQVNRLTLSVNMEIDSMGTVVNHEIYESVIKTVERLTYTDVSDILEQVERPELSKYDYLVDNFKLMAQLQGILREKRMRRGMIDFNFAEPKIILDEMGHPIDIIKEERRIANKIIEEFMLAANETVAEHMHWLEIPFVYRIHEMPSEEKIAAFNKVIHNFGYFVKGQHGDIHPKAIQNLLTKLEGKKEEHLISKLMLRSLKQAKYSPINEGHFGLASEYYCHFTSPIRRYPDLQIHRIIKEVLAGTMNEARIKRLEQIVAEASLQSSEQERLAEQAERDTDDLKMAEYLSGFIGEEFVGFVSTVTSFGMYIELENMCEGLVHVKSLMDDYYIYDEDTMSMTGERTKKRYTVGDEVIIVVDKVDIDARTVDFVIVKKLEA
ncbi:MAG: ribonuclease R [Clostridia bacterium]|nr:ribonuclease R [Clostridia bacterium]